MRFLTRLDYIILTWNTMSTTRFVVKQVVKLSGADTSHRFIPNREGQDIQASFSLLHDDGSPATPSKQKKRAPQGELHFQRSR